MAGALLLAAGAAAEAAQTPARPNIVFIISDDHRADSMGAAGNPAIHTPALDRLAREGVHFRQGTVHVSQCVPSRANLLSGLPPHQNGFTENATQRDRFEMPTLPGLLRQASYRTVLVGKWHLKTQPWDSGFSEVRLWHPDGAGPFLDNPKLAYGNTREAKARKGYTNALFADDAINFLSSPAARERPFFLWLAPTAPHTPWRPVPPNVERLYAGKTSADLLPPGFPKDTPTNNFAAYYGAVSHVDEQVGRVLEALDERKLAQNTVVVFLGDNGHMMGEKGWGVRGAQGKVMPYEGSVRVPFLLRAPMLASARGASDAPVSSLDLPPTLLALAGATPPKEWAGRDLTALLRGDKNHGINEAYSEWAGGESRAYGHLTCRLVRTPTHKLIRWEDPKKPDELYDLKADPREAKNLIDDPAARGVRDDLMGRLQKWMEQTKDPAREWKQGGPAGA